MADHGADIPYPDAVTSPQPRPNVSEIPAYVAGKPPVPVPGLTTYKLSSNENPYPPLPGVVEAAVAAAERMNRYPDMGNAELYAALSPELGVPVEDLALATGSVALIYQLVQAFCEPGDEVVFAWRSFEAYPIAVAASAATAVKVPVLADGRHDLDAMAAAVTDRTRVVLVCTPNNPTGPAVTQAELDAFLARVPPHVLVVVDEAYVEFVRMDDPVDGAGGLPRPVERGGHPHVLQGLRAGRLPGRVRRRARRRSRPRCGRCRCRSASPASPRRRPSLHSSASRSCWSGSTRSLRSGSGWSSSCAKDGWNVPGAAGQLRLVRAGGADPRVRRRRR